MHSLGAQLGLQRNNSLSDRGQRGTDIQKSPMPYPQMPMPVMHKAEKKYEVGKVADEEEVKQRQLKAILNKLTPQNFEKLFQQVKEVNIDNDITLSGVVSQIFDAVLMMPTFCEMYANFCFYLAADLPELTVDNQKITFKRLLLNKCQEEFERGEREEQEANKAEEEGEVKQSAEAREEKRLRARRRMLGNIRLIGELYKTRMLTERIMHECINKLLGQHHNPDEENIEALCKLMSTIGEMIDHPKAKEHMDAYYDIMTQLSNNMKLSSRVRFMLKDSIDLRKNKWQQRRKVEGAEKIDEVHRDAAQERQAQSGWEAATSNAFSARSEPIAPSTPGKAPGDASTSFSLQYGSMSPGFVNVMQARCEFLKKVSALPTLSAPMQHFPKKDSVVVDQPNAGELHPPSKSKRDAQVSTPQSWNQLQKPSLHPIRGLSMQLPFHQPQTPLQFGGPNPQTPLQAMSGMSLPMPIPMSLPLGNPPGQHSMFVPGLQPHPKQPQAMMRQGQSLNFSPPIMEFDHPDCPCGAGRMIIREANTPNNRERRFYFCPTGVDHDGGFLWVDVWERFRLSTAGRSHIRS